MPRIAVVLGLVLVVAGALWAAEAVVAPKVSTYTDALYGFTIHAPAFAKAEQGNVIPVMMLGPADGGFCPNINVMIQNGAPGPEDYRKVTLEQFKAAGFKVNSEENRTVSGKSAILWNYEGVQQGRNLQFLSLAVFDSNRVFLITCTATKETFPNLEKKFAACVSSFAFAK